MHLFFIFSLTIFLSACSHKKSISVQRQPSQNHEISNATFNKNPALLKQLLQTMKKSTQLVAAFDQHIADSKTPEQLDKLFQSQLYCELWSLRQITLDADSKIEQDFRNSIKDGEDQWYLGQLQQFAKEDPASLLTASNILRNLVHQEESICQTKKCVSKRIDNLTFFYKKSQVDFLNDPIHAAFAKSVKKVLAQFSGVKNKNMKNLKLGDCFSSTKKSDQESYDWKNRNWIGSILPDGEFVFTYDDGPHPSYTQNIRDVWENAEMSKPAFFWLSDKVKTLNDLVQKFALDGYSIGSHSISHPDLGNLAVAKSVDDLNQVNKSDFADELPNVTDFQKWKLETLDKQIYQSVGVISSIIQEKVPNYKVKYFRLPYGSGVKNDLIGERFQKLNVDHFFWRVDSLDWQDKNPISIRDRVISQMKIVKKGIVLFHDVHPQTVEASKLMIQYLQDNPDFKAVPITKLVP